MNPSVSNSEVLTKPSKKNPLETTVVKMSPTETAKVCHYKENKGDQTLTEKISTCSSSSSSSCSLSSLSSSLGKYGYDDKDHSKKSSSECLNKKESQRYGYHSNSSSHSSEESSCENSHSSHHHLSRSKDLADEFKDILKYVLKDHLLDDETSKHKGLIDHVVQIVDETDDLCEIRKIIVDHLKKLGNYHPKSLTLGSFFFGSYLPSDKYVCGNKYCDSICAFSLPDFDDDKQKCKANVVYVKKDGKLVVVDNEKDVAIVYLNGESKRLTRHQVSQLKDMGCKKTVVYHDNKYLGKVDLADDSCSVEASQSSKSKCHEFDKFDSDSDCSTSSSDSSCYHHKSSKSDSSCHHKSSESDSSCHHEISKSDSSCHHKSSKSDSSCSLSSSKDDLECGRRKCKSKGLFNGRFNAIWVIIFIIIIILIIWAVRRRRNTLTY